jgi:hypothetical protein
MAKKSHAPNKPVTNDPGKKLEQKKNLIELEGINSTTSLPNELNNKIGKIDSDLDDLRSELSKTDRSVKSSLSHLSDKGSDIRPQKTFGDGNVIHGSKWVSKQPADNHTIHLATLRDKQAIYKLSERYHTYLDEDLAYLPVTVNNTQRYALIYGNFPAVTTAESALNRLPRMIGRHRPSVHSMRQVQTFIKE